jgi:hypothetical protein
MTYVIDTSFDLRFKQLCPLVVVQISWMRSDRTTGWAACAVKNRDKKNRTLDLELDEL